MQCSFKKWKDLYDKMLKSHIVCFLIHSRFSEW